MSSEGRILIDSRIVLDDLESFAVVLGLLRTERASTRPDLVRLSGLGRAAVNQRITEAIQLGLVAEDSPGPSTGGRAPRRVRFKAEAGLILTAELGATSLAVGLSDLSGQMLRSHEEPSDIARGPDAVLTRVSEVFDSLLADVDDLGGAALWGIGVGVPGPVQFTTGRPVSPPIMPGWDQYPIRGRLSDQYQVPVWVDNDVNLMALGELRAGLGQEVQDMIFVKVGTGIGSGLISGGSLHRGADGCAGDIGHIAVTEHSDIICRCGRTGCLEAVAGGAALAREGRRAAENGSSPHLRRLMDNSGSITIKDVVTGASFGDPVSFELLMTSAQTIGAILAGMVNFFNPSLICIGGQVADSGEPYLASVRHAIYSRSLPLATSNLKVIRSPSADRVGMRGAVFMVTDELFAPGCIAQWIGHQSPIGQPHVVEQRM